MSNAERIARERIEKMLDPMWSVSPVEAKTAICTHATAIAMLALLDQVTALRAEVRELRETR